MWDGICNESLLFVFCRCDSISLKPNFLFRYRSTSQYLPEKPSHCLIRNGQGNNTLGPGSVPSCNPSRVSNKIDLDCFEEFYIVK